MLGLMQDWPLRIHRIIDHAAQQHGQREVVSRSVEGPIHRTTYAGVRERAALEMIFPRVVGYRIDLPEEKLQANFTPNSKLTLTPDMVGPGQTLLDGIVGDRERGAGRCQRNEDGRRGQRDRFVHRGAPFPSGF